MPSLPTDPTPTEVLAYRNRAAGRISIGWDALRRILLDVLPGAILKANTDEGRNLPVPARALVAPEDLGDDFPMWIVSSSQGLSDFSFMSQMQSNTIIVLAYSSMLTQPEIKDSNDLLDLVCAALYPYRGGHSDAQSNKVWDILAPTARSFVSGIPEWKDARGFGQHFNLTQYPNSPRWNDTNV